MPSRPWSAPATGSGIVARRRGSLRRRAYAVVLAVVAAPVVLIFAAQLLDADEARRMAEAAARGAEAARAAAAKDGYPAAIGAAVDAAARRERVRVRLIDGEGRVLEDSDHEPATSVRDRLGDLFFGPEGAPSLRAHEAEAPPLLDRPGVRRALAEGRSEGCERAMGGKLLVCEVAIRVGSASASPAGARLVLAQKSSPRAIRALYDVRWPVLKLTFYVLLAGLALATWLARRIVRPVEQLRAEVLARAASPLSSDPIPTPPAPGEIGDLAGAFNALLAAIAERSRQNHAFMADLAHELKSPVAAVRAAAEVMGEDGPVDAARAARLRRVLAESGRRLDALVTQFLELARAEAGLPNEERTRLDLAELARGLVDALREDERRAGVRFELDAEPAPALVVAGRLEAALRNVLDNAASFAGEGGAVRVRVRAEGGACAIEVSDTGPGIAPEILPRVFDRFFTDRPGGEGTGLGLALAKAIVEAHGGTITAASPPGSGAVFTIRLPLAITPQEGSP